MSADQQPTNYGPMHGGPETYGVRIQVLETHLRDAANMLNTLTRAMSDRRVDEAVLQGQVTAAVLAATRAADAVDKLADRFETQSEDLREQIGDWRRELNGRLNKAESAVAVLQTRTSNLVCADHAADFADNKRRLEALEESAGGRPMSKGVKWTGISVAGLTGIWVILEWIGSKFATHADKVGK